jgi:hypothetical protein
MAHPQVADGGDGLQIWRVAANIMNKKSRKADKGWSSTLEVGWGTPRHEDVWGSRGIASRILNIDTFRSVCYLCGYYVLPL